MVSSRSSRLCVVAATAALLTSTQQAQASPIESTTGSISNGATSLPQGVSVTMTGGIWTSSYNGDGHVVGSASSHAATSYTLANKDGGQFLINNNGGGYNAITMQFSAPIYAISFDYEVFPNGNMANGTGKNSSSPGWPDFVFLADGATVFTTYGVMSNADPLGGTNGFSYSPASGANVELAPQFIGSTGMLYFPGGVTTLEFEDWPPTIGVDNINLYFTPQINPPATVPEPTTLTVFACGAAALCVLRRRITSASGRTSCGRTP